MQTENDIKEDAMSNIIVAKGITREFHVGGGIVRALYNVDVEIEKGSLTILRGRSGSGKTTLINILGALDKPTNGEVFLDGKDITKLLELERDKIRREKIGFVFQSVALISTMSAFENIDFILRIAGYPPKEREARVIECLKMVGLEGRMNHKPFELSGGEQQRVAIARAFSHNPDIIFADEPTAELDSATAAQIVELFKELSVKNGTTVVMTTHDPSILEVADKVYTLEDGEVVE
jgi:putative ABC transport system ATP-binding protein